MQSDAVVWDIINHSFCSYKAKVAKERTFCQNEYNVTGLCIRSACPLANSAYATIREENGVCYLYQKTVERAHTPKHLWEKIKLPANYTKALELVSKQLEFYPKYLVHRNKQRLTKIHQMIIRMRKLKLKARVRIETTNAKVDKREVRKEEKALKAAKLDRAIEEELLERLKQVSESEIYNYPSMEYNKALGRAKNSFKDSGEAEEEVDVDDDGEMEDGEGEGLEEELEDEEDGKGLQVEYVEDFEESGDEADIEEVGADMGLSGFGGGKKGARSADKAGRGGSKKRELEYEEEAEAPVMKTRARNLGW
jgi:protein MAK16